MFSTEKKLLSAFCASVFTLSAMAAATTVIEQPFATTGDLTVDAYKENWSGNGTVEGLEEAPTVTVGKPIAEATDTNVLCVQGTVRCAAPTAENKPATVDMMIQIARPDDALELPSGEGETAQIAVGVDANGKLNVYCKNKQGKAAWHLLGDTAYTEGSWHRMSLTFDYGKGTCQISLDGVALVSANGYITADPAKNEDVAGSWYKLNASATKLTAVKVVGSTAIDEMVVKHGDTNADVLPVPEGNTGDVPNAWLLAQGVADPTAKAPDGSNLTVAQKYLVGLNVVDGEKFEMKSMAMAGDKVTISHPKFNPVPGKTVKIAYGATAACSAGNVAAESDGSTEITLPTDTNVFYYKLVVE